MKKHFKTFRVTSILLLIAFLNSLLLPGIVLGQEVKCSYDPGNPTLDSARKNFLALNYVCAEEELTDFLKIETLTTEQRADGHVLMAEVYYAKVRNDTEKRSKVISQFVAAFESYREWKGELNIKSPEFMGMMKEAQTKVDAEAAAGPAEEAEAVETVEKPAEEEKVEPTVVPVTDGKKKAWYKNWWAIALGVGVVAGGVVLLTGGGGDDEPTPTDDPLADFPDPPVTGK